MSRTWRLLLWPLLVVAAVGASFAYLDMDTAGLFSGKGLGQMAAYASEFFPPDLSAPGPNAGTLALALHTGGVLGRLFAEALENTPAQPAEALRLAGSGRLAAFAYGTLPGVWPQLVAYTLYRWENNIRMASVLGFVGAGGLGQMLYFSLSLFQQAQAATVILAMLVLVLGVDSLSAWARQRWVSQ
ncbi:ABC transporter permease subunit [Pseudomonas aeruginosa]|uniref:PhnE/PtxC family ABC transporter permease n=1 Tax=Pseudomonas aeruginosa TaxID=287 RepID=UPI001C855E7D|nr:ABC transporter permease subunit [Pseudomonas aeruginosa]QZD67673.1 ABC transporter permease subunit [Pseudomonas aeruginosa]